MISFISITSIPTVIFFSILKGDNSVKEMLNKMKQLFAEMAMLVPHAFSAVNAGIGVYTLAANTLADENCRVTCTLKVHNWTNELLADPVVRIAGGQVAVPPCYILPGECNVVVARKTAHTATGTYGTMSWLLKEKKRRVVVMWSAPFNFSFYENWLAVGMTGIDVTDHAEENTWYKQMYYQKSDKLLKFSKMKYKNGIQPVIFVDDGIEISGTMSTTHHAQAKIIISPLSSSNYAHKIKKCFS